MSCCGRQNNVAGDVRELDWAHTSRRFVELHQSIAHGEEPELREEPVLLQPVHHVVEGEVYVLRARQLVADHRVAVREDVLADVVGLLGDQDEAELQFENT